MALQTVYVDHAAADTSGVGSAGDPWKYLWQATAAIKTDAGTNHYLVHVKASATYGTDENAGTSLESDDAGHDGAGGDAGAVLHLDQVSPGITTPNVFQGYETNVGDGGIVSIDCQGATNQLTYGIRINIDNVVYAVFKNFDVQNASDGGIQGGNTSDVFTLKNCRAKSCGGVGVNGDNYVNMENCVFDNNTDGINIDSNCAAISCIFSNNSSEGFNGLVNCFLYQCLIYDNGDTSQVIFNGGDSWVLNCTIDANNQANSRCVRQDSVNAPLNVINSIIYDANIGILNDSDLGEMCISRNNLYFSNTADVSGFLAVAAGDGVGDRGDVEADPAFTGTYVPGVNAQSKGLDAHFTNAFWASFDGAANPPFT